MDEDDLLECSICLSLLCDPCTLPCGHTFCLQCIEQHLSTATRQKCPLCNTPVPSGHQLRVSILARQLVEAVAETRQRTAQHSSIAAAAPEERCPGQGCQGRVQHPGRVEGPPPQPEQPIGAASGQEGPELMRGQPPPQQPDTDNATAPPAERPPDMSPLQVLPAEAQEGWPWWLGSPGNEREELSTPPAPLAAAAARGAAVGAGPSPQPQVHAPPFLHALADAAAKLAQLVLLAMLSLWAGPAGGAAWAALGVLLPPALAVHGLAPLRALLLAAAALRLAAARRWRLLATLLAGAAASGVWGPGWRLAPPPAPW